MRRSIIGFWGNNAADKQLRAFLEWASDIAVKEDVTEVVLPNRRAYYFFEFPLRYGDEVKRSKVIPSGKRVTFLFRSTRHISPKDIQPSPDSWMTIFSSPEIEIWENKSRSKETGIPPLYWGLDGKERKLALQIARDALEKFLSRSEHPGPEYFDSLPQRFFSILDLDVALWTNGRLRGSAVIENSRLGQGIAEAAILACRDRRFKPLSPEELQETRIEVTLMHNLRVPLSADELKRNVIYPEKGYLLERGQNKGWYLPEVFNVRRFRNLEEFLSDLAQEKAGLPRTAAKKVDVLIFEVDDFIESRDRTMALSLWGPTIKPNFKFQIANYEFYLRAAADWLCKIQEPDGNIPPIINPLTFRQTQIDWPRLAFTAWALAEFGKATNEEKYVQAAGKSFEYLKKFLIPNSQFLIPGYELTLAYFGQLALHLEKINEASTTADRILARLNTLNLEPITFAQIASFFKAISKVNRRFSTPFENLTQILKENFEKNLRGRLPMNLAVWAELVNTSAGIEQEFSDKVADWLKAQQLQSGAFPESTVSNFVYTRGTGKIFEALTIDSEKNKEAIERALQWLLSMQYDEGNTFFVSEEIRPRILGAIRHDYFNPEVWVDAAGHILLGKARLIRKQPLWK